MHAYAAEGPWAPFGPGFGKRARWHAKMAAFGPALHEWYAAQSGEFEGDDERGERRGPRPPRAPRPPRGGHGHGFGPGGFGPGFGPGGPGFGGPGPFGPGGPWGGGRWGRGPKARRGDIRAAILAVLNEGPRNGYQIIQEISTRSEGAWRPSPGSIYPTLQQLEDEGLVYSDADGGKRSYALTDEGRRYVTEHADEVTAPWQAMAEAGETDNLKPLLGQVAAAMWQIASTGTPAQQAKGREALVELRKKLYAILSEDDSDS